jgi:hypothetical protein
MSRVDIPIMQNTTVATDPLSYPQVTTALVASCHELWKILPWFETFLNLAWLTIVSKKVSA